MGTESDVTVNGDVNNRTLCRVQAQYTRSDVPIDSLPTKSTSLPQNPRF
ncbi:hypothetical protein Poly41_13280 [Novipirellula artificiosorum]|uniref:Uncharacterized protein n=1 Tax=Novipirellula artificiosorum TaxID=2528016 RepID=A0A5C6DVW2_9BACT|nr:hypothetical protein Poly41_13280 [Novipirellula artificiosorum]